MVCMLYNNIAFVIFQYHTQQLVHVIEAVLFLSGACYFHYYFVTGYIICLLTVWKLHCPLGTSCLNLDISHFDYSTLLLAGLSASATEALQIVQDSAASLVFKPLNELMLLH